MTKGNGETRDDNGTDRGKYDGILLLTVMAGVLALLLSTACMRNKEFDEATASAQHNANPSRTEECRQPLAEQPQKPREKKVYNIKPGVRNHDRIAIYFRGNLKEFFNDSNKYQYAAAERLGMQPIREVGTAYFTSRPIVKVVSNEYYTVDTLKHSFPYLVPEAERCLRDIGANFIDSLASRGADSYRILVTSLLRTPYTVKRLRRVNRNAVDSSTHQFGTTFDISYTRFHNTDPSRTIHEEDLKNLLAEVLRDMRNDNRCLVIFERKGGCFHITATR